MKITEYPQTNYLVPENVFLVDGPSGTQTINTIDLGKELVPKVVPEMHRMIFRGKNLGSTVYGFQLQAIREGVFDDLFVGDYWEINDIIWRIVDINYWFNCGDSPFNVNHLVIMPDWILYQNVMNYSTYNMGDGYAGSTMRTINLDDAKTTINAAFGEKVRSHRQVLTNSVIDGKPSGWAWYDSIVDLPNQINMYGSSIFTSVTDVNNIPSSIETIDKQQFALFAIKPSFILDKFLAGQWLRDVVADNMYAMVSGYGHAGYYGATNYLGVRPCFAIG